MDLNNLAKILIELPKDEVDQLMNIVKDMKGNTVIIKTDDDPICPQGFVWSQSAGKCIADVGGLGG